MPQKDSITLMLEEPASSVGVLPTGFTTPWNQNPSNKIFYLTSGSIASFKHFSYEEIRKEFSKPSFLQGTIGKFEFNDYLQILTLPDITQSARVTIRTISNRDIAVYAEKLLLVIRNQLDKLEFEDRLPEIRAFERDNGSLLIEWIFDHFRIGFSVEISREESGWYLVSGHEFGDILAYGGLTGQNLNKLIAWLLNFVITNYV